MRTADDVVTFLAECRREAGVPKIGAREVEVVASMRRDGVPTRAGWRTLRWLHDRGIIRRSGGFCYLPEDAVADPVSALARARGEED